MARFRGALLVVALAALPSGPAAAQIGGHPFEFSGTAGIFAPDIRAHMETAQAFNGALGWRGNPLLSLEGQGTWAPSHADTSPGQKHNFFIGGLDLRWNLRPAQDRLVPYALFGVGIASSHTTGRPPDLAQRGAGTVGFGILANVVDQRYYLRFQVRDIMFRERGQQEFSNHVAVTAGLHLVWRGRPMDQDRDGVRDWIDKCPNTPYGARVTADGCPIDTDGDTVFDGLDKCENTPKGCKIDKDGCPIDSDGDGVCDGIDQCADTPKGATVDARGCPSDGDGDGILDGLDKCPDTPKGALIDEVGCSKDADGDGVADGLDVCPNTPAGLKVDPSGCPIEVSEKEIQLLDTGSIRIQNINFETGKANLKPESYSVIDTVANILIQYPTLQIEIGGHTDNTGSRTTNQKLSQARADSVLEYLKTKLPAGSASQYSAKGYGPDRPVAPNSTALGKAKNRRVEFKVMNTEALRIERDKRRFLLKGESAPPVIPTPPPAPAEPDTTKR